MKKNEVEDLLKKYLEGKTTIEEEQLLDRHLEDPFYKQEMEFYRHSEAQELPASFDDKVARSLSKGKKSVIQLGSLTKIAAVFLLVFLSVLLVRMYTSYNQLLAKMEAIQSTLAITLIDHRSVHMKLKAIELAEELPEMKPELSQSLIDLLNNDENVNVRMAAIQTVSGFSESQFVKTELIRSLKQQKSFLVRAILVENLLQMNDPSIIKEMMKIIEDKRTEQELRDQIKEMIL